VIVADLPRPALESRLENRGLSLRTGGYVTRIRTSIPAVASGVARLYAEYPVTDDLDFADFQVTVRRPAGVRGWIKAQSQFYVDGQPPFKPLPLAQAFPLLEWGLNWCISSHCHDHLVIHAAALERDGKTAILPAPPGSGKSTLCAALVHDGWRLLSDELTLVRLDDSRLAPLPRPVSLKNGSIDIIRRRAPDAVFSPVVRDTVKGSVAHMKPPRDSIARASETAAPGWIVFPRFAGEQSPARLSLLPKSEAFLRAAGNAFNYSLLGLRGFEALAGVVDASECYEFAYGKLDDALAIFAAL
jgi:HprK-related kinase A